MNNNEKNYFELFNVAIGFKIDEALLQQRYRTMLIHLHPDRLTDASSEERKIAAQFIADLHDAYQTLIVPIKRAEYLLQLKNHARCLDEPATVQNPALLEKQFVLREELDAIENEAERELFFDRIENEKVDLIEKIEHCFEDGVLDEVCELLLELKFIERLR